MNLGFYYHIPVIPSAQGLRIPAYLGVFLDALAEKVDTLTLFMHEACSLEKGQYDYILKSHNISYCSLGQKTPAWDRFLWPSKTLNKIKDKAIECDWILVRAPSPLAPAFSKYLKPATKIAYFVVGDYVEGAKHLDQPWWRKLPIILLSIINDKQLTASLKRTKTIVNSKKLYEKYDPYVSDLHVVKTTTLTYEDFHKRQDTCAGSEIRLLYTGSYSLAKGLRELIEAFALLCRSRKNLTLHFVGWDYDITRPIETYLKREAEKLGVAQKVIFHGFKTVGPELNEMYRMADIYIIPSYHEGFPRTIWEAMANSLPVIATKVGSIPYFLCNRHDALLIDPKDSAQIAEAVDLLIEHCDLRQKLIRNGFGLASENTLEALTSKMVQLLENG